MRIDILTHMWIYLCVCCLVGMAADGTSGLSLHGSVPRGPTADHSLHPVCLAFDWCSGKHQDGPRWLPAGRHRLSPDISDVVLLFVFPSFVRKHAYMTLNTCGKQGFGDMPLGYQLLMSLTARALYKWLSAAQEFPAELISTGNALCARTSIAAAVVVVILFSLRVRPGCARMNMAVVTHIDLLSPIHFVMCV